MHEDTCREPRVAANQKGGCPVSNDVCRPKDSPSPLKISVPLFLCGERSWFWLSLILSGLAVAELSSPPVAD